MLSVQRYGWKQLLPIFPDSINLEDLCWCSPSSLAYNLLALSRASPLHLRRKIGLKITSKICRYRSFFNLICYLISKVIHLHSFDSPFRKMACYPRVPSGPIAYNGPLNPRSRWRETELGWRNAEPLAISWTSQAHCLHCFASTHGKISILEYNRQS